jgi:uncharacterized repeat protein (TIGR01451 family)
MKRERRNHLGTSAFACLALVLTLLVGMPTLQPAKMARAAAGSGPALPVALRAGTGDPAAAAAPMAPAAPLAINTTTTIVCTQGDCPPTPDDPDPSVVGQTYQVYFQVAPTSSTGGVSVDGTVTVSDGTGATCSRTVGPSTTGWPYANGWQWNCGLTSTSAGAKMLTATFTPLDPGAFNGSSGTEPHLVNKANTTTAMSFSPASPRACDSVSFTAVVSVVSPGGGTPSSGTVTFYEGVTALGSGTLNASGQATYSTSSLSVGSHLIRAVYAGNANYNGSTSPGANATVAKATSTTTVTTLAPNPSTFGNAVTMRATVTGGCGTRTGVVSFNDGGVVVGSATLNASGVANLAVTNPAAGPHAITAVYGGDGTYLASTSAPHTHTVNKANTTTALAGMPNPSVYSQTVTFTATVAAIAPGSGIPVGTVTFRDGAAYLGSAALDGAGRAVFGTGDLGTGPHSITAEYGGNANYNTSTSSPLAHTVNQASTTTTLDGAPSPSTYGQTVAFVATVAAVAPGSGAPAGTVTFRDDGAYLGSATLDGSGQATFDTASLAPGAHSITAEYAGSANYGGSTSAPLSVTVLTEADVSIQKTSGTGTAFTGEQRTYSIRVTNHDPSDAQNGVVLDVLPDEVMYTVDTTGGYCTQPAELVGFRAALSGADEVPPVVTPASGRATFVLHTGTNELTYALRVSQIGSITGASIHTGAAGVNGPVLVTLYSGTPSFDPNHPLMGSVALDPADAAAILADPAGFYVDVHTAAYPAGEVRGQMARATNTPLRCELGTLKQDQDKQFEVFATVQPETVPGTTIANVAIVTSTTDLGDADLSNNVASAVELVQGKADLRVVKFGIPSGEVRAGKTLTYTVIVDNLGPGYAHTVVLTDVLQSDGTFDLLSVDSDRPAACAPTSGTITGRLDLRCDLTGALEVMSLGASGRWTLTVIVTANEHQTISNVAHVLGTDFDPALSNNQASVEHNITDVADLALAKTALGEVQADGQPGGAFTLVPDQVTAGRSLTYTLLVTNDGPSTAENVAVQDHLPAWIVLTGVTPSQGSCIWGTPGDPLDKLTCGLGTLAPRASATVVVGVRMPAWVADGTTLQNDALVFGDTFDPDNGNNFATNHVTVSAYADLWVAKTQEPEMALPGQEIVYTIRVGNRGPSDAPGATVRDAMPDGITGVTWECAASGGVVCMGSGTGSISATLDLPAGAALTYTVRGTLTSAGVVTNTATVTAPALVADPYGDDNSDSVANAPYVVFLPLAVHSEASADPAPDLVVERITASSSEVEVVIANRGDAPVTDEFWVDVYVDPEPVPTGVNQTWRDLCDEGLVWGVEGGALPLGPGESLTLTVGDAYYYAPQSHVSWPLAAGVPVYAQADSFNAATSYGAVLEAHEIDGGAYNNIASTVSVAGAAVSPPR